MSRPVILSNGSLAVGLNEYGLVHDFYYPFVGLDNLTTARSMHHKIGIWVDNIFSWVDSAQWHTTVDFETDALVSVVRMTNATLGIELLLQDFVMYNADVFARRVEVRNNTEKSREIRVFFHQVFQISRAGRGDTALYEPDEKYILDYKGRCSLLIYAESNGKPCDQYAVGNYGIEGKQGTFIDAEDGELSMSAVEHGGVDSVLRITATVSAHASTQIDYWIVVADSQFRAEKIHHIIKEKGLGFVLDDTREYWNDWLAIGKKSLEKMDKKYADACKKSLMIIKSHIDNNGGIIASCDSSIYNYGRDYYSYVWPRDGAYVLWPLIRMGYFEEAKKFFSFCRDILTDDGYLMHKYQPDKSIGSTWHPLIHNKKSELGIQEDETATVLFMLSEYCHYSNDYSFAEELYETLIQPAANFMSNYLDTETGLPHASYDLWEEKFLTTTYTTSVTYRSLLVSADFADRFGHEEDKRLWRVTAQKLLSNAHQFYNLKNGYYTKGYLLDNKKLSHDETLDVSSFYGVITYGYFKEHDGEKIASMAKKLEQELLDFTPVGGISRYFNDTYFEVDPSYRGNPWIVTTLWMAQYYSRIKNHKKAMHYIDWALDKALPSGVLSEQINPQTNKPSSVAPLIWSHAELINALLIVQHIN